MSRYCQISIGIALWIVGTTGCVRVDPDGAFAQTVHPVLTANCQYCHQGPQAYETPYDAPGDFGDADLNTAYIAALDYVEPGAPEESVLLQMVSGSPPAMPPTFGDEDEGLTAEETAAIRDWIAAGALSE